jgi:hypothetical protein
LGSHRLLCADSTDARSFDYLLDGKQAEMVFIDPPYNVRIGGNVSGLGQIKHREFAMASGEMSEAVFTAFLKAAFGNLIAHSVDGSIHFVCMDWRHCFEVLSAARDVYAENPGWLSCHQSASCHRDLFGIGRGDLVLVDRKQATRRERRARASRI